MNISFAKTFLLSRAGLTAAFALSSSVAAHAYVIDNFTNPEAVVELHGPGAATTNGFGSGAGILGTERDWKLTLAPSSVLTDLAAYEVNVVDGLVYSNRAGTNSSLLLTYDGIDSGADTNALNLIGVNLTADGSNAIRLQVGTVDLSTTFTFTIYSGAGTTLTSSITLSGIGSLTSQTLPYSSFTGTGSFADVRAITIAINPLGNSRDVNIRQIDTVLSGVPEPSTAMVAVGLVGCVGLVRRRRA